MNVELQLKATQAVSATVSTTATTALLQRFQLQQVRVGLTDRKDLAVLNHASQQALHLHEFTMNRTESPARRPSRIADKQVDTEDK